jgi:D-serine deaminase-like pyridoxal phosphate-dependent protein
MLQTTSGLNIKSISGGSSPTAQYVAGIDGITEVRAGNYIFKDMGAVKLGIADIEQCAAMVLSTVVSTPEKNRAVIDSGNKSISADTVLHSYPHFHEGHAVVCGNDDLIFDYLNEEHGMITSKSGCTNLRVGQRILLVPSHVCTTINLHDSVYFKEVDGQLRKVEVAARGKLQ